MGIFEKLKDIFAKSSLESIQDLEKEIKLLHGKAMFSDIVAIIGTGGRLKGLPLIYSAKKEDEFKILVARISELINPIKNLENQNELVEIDFMYKSLYLIYVSIKENIGFLGVSPMMDEIMIFRDWIKKNSKILSTLFST